MRDLLAIAKFIIILQQKQSVAPRMSSVVDVLCQMAFLNHYFAKYQRNLYTVGMTLPELLICSESVTTTIFKPPLATAGFNYCIDAVHLLVCLSVCLSCLSVCCQNAKKRYFLKN